MKLNDYLNLTSEQLNAMSETELDKAISYMRKSNKQALRRLHDSYLGTHSPAYQVGKKAHMFAKKSMDKEVSDYVSKSTRFVREEAEKRNRLVIKRRQLNELIAWRKLKTATPKGWKETRDKTAEKLGMTTKSGKKKPKDKKKMTLKFEKSFWNLFNRFQDEYITYVYNEGSPVIMEIIASILREHADWSEDTIIKEAKRQLDEYHNSRRKKKTNVRTSDIFDF